MLIHLRVVPTGLLVVTDLEVEPAGCSVLSTVPFVLPEALLMHWSLDF